MANKNNYLIVLDTNIIWTDDSDYSKIFNSQAEDISIFLKKHKPLNNFKICIPKVVLKERICQRLEIIKSKIESLKENRTKLNEFLNGSIVPKKDTKKILEKKAKDFIDKNKIIIFDYPEISQKEITEEACTKKPPFFRDGKQEYKDRVIWETIKENAKKDGNNYLFLTNNKTDFNHEILKKEFGTISSKDFEIFPDVATLKIYLDNKFDLRLNLNKLYKEKEEEIKENLNKILYNISGEKKGFSWGGRESLIVNVLVEEFNIDNISENLLYAEIEIRGKAKFLEKDQNQTENEINSLPRSYIDIAPRYISSHYLLQKNYEEKEVTIKVNLNLNDYSIESFSITEGVSLSPWRGSWLK